MDYYDDDDPFRLRSSQAPQVQENGHSTGSPPFHFHQQSQDCPSDGQLRLAPHFIALMDSDDDDPFMLRSKKAPSNVLPPPGPQNVELKGAKRKLSSGGSVDPLKHKRTNSNSKGMSELKSEIQELRKQTENQRSELVSRNSQLLVENEELHQKLEKAEEEKKKSIEERSKMEDERSQQMKMLQALRDSESKRTSDWKSQIQELRRQMEDDRLESESRISQLKSENEELLKRLEKEKNKSMEERSKMEEEHCQQMKKLQKLSSSFATLLDSESRRTRELQAENDELTRKLKRATEANGKFVEERRKSLLEQLAEFSQGNKAQPEGDASSIFT